MCDAADNGPISPWGPICVALLSSAIRGLTGFGDGIAFQTLWSLASLLGLLPSNGCPAVLRRTVLYAVIMQALTMPLQLWQSRAQLRTIAGYGGVMVAAGTLAACLPALSPAWFPDLSPVYSPPAMLALLVPAAMLGGALGGLTGAGGPPLMAAYSLLDLPKDTLRGFGVVPSAFMLVRLAMYTHGEGAVFDPRPPPQGELGVYVGIVAAALVGALLGDRARARFNADAIVTMLLLLVLLGSGLMLRLFRDPAVTAAYCALVVVGCAGFAAAWVLPRACVACVGRCCWASHGKRAVGGGTSSAVVVPGASSP